MSADGPSPDHEVLLLKLVHGTSMHIRLEEACDQIIQKEEEGTWERCPHAFFVEAQERPGLERVYMYTRRGLTSDKNWAHLLYWSAHQAIYSSSHDLWQNINFGYIRALEDPETGGWVLPAVNMEGATPERIFAERCGRDELFQSIWVQEGDKELVLVPRRHP